MHWGKVHFAHMQTVIAVNNRQNLFTKLFMNGLIFLKKETNKNSFTLKSSAHIQILSL